MRQVLRRHHTIESPVSASWEREGPSRDSAKRGRQIPRIMHSRGTLPVYPANTHEQISLLLMIKSNLRQAYFVKLALHNALQVLCQVHALAAFACILWHFLIKLLVVSKRRDLSKRRQFVSLIIKIRTATYWALDLHN